MSSHRKGRDDAGPWSTAAHVSSRQRPPGRVSSRQRQRQWSPRAHAHRRESEWKSLWGTRRSQETSPKEAVVFSLELFLGRPQAHHGQGGGLVHSRLLHRPQENVSMRDVCGTKGCRLDLQHLPEVVSEQ